MSRLGGTELAAALAAGLASWMLVGALRDWLAGTGMTRANYAGHSLPAAGGLLFPVVLIVCLAAYAVGLASAGAAVAGEPPPGDLRRVLAVQGMAVGVLCLVGLAGWNDDRVSCRSGPGPRGIRGHLGVLLGRGRVSSGLLKALVGLGAGCIVAAVPLGGRVFVGWGSLLLFGADALLFALCTNSVNLLDRRPGRAIKGFLLLAFLLLATITAWGRLSRLGALLPVWVALPGPLLALLPLDLGERLMLGDTGANYLGAVLGLAALWGLPATGRLSLLLLLAAFHYLCERRSLSQVIAGCGLLHRLDSVGRRDGRRHD